VLLGDRAPYLLEFYSILHELNCPYLGVGGGGGGVKLEGNLNNFLKT